ncbi:MAG: hypothetical protein AAF662_05270 [Pseudomonadota bacterium]
MTEYSPHLRHPEELESAILRHMDRTRVTISWVVRRYFFPAHAYPDRKEARVIAEKVLGQLVKKKKAIEIESPGRTKTKLYLPAGSRQGEAAIGYDLGKLWATYVRPVPRYPLTNEELRELLAPCPYKNIRHVIEPSSDVEGARTTGIIWRLYPTSAEVKEVIRSVKKIFRDAKKNVAEHIENGDYGLLVLAETKSKATAINKSLARSGESGGPLADRARISVEFAPRPESLAKALKELQI